MGKWEISAKKQKIQKESNGNFRTKKYNHQKAQQENEENRGNNQSSRTQNNRAAQPEHQKEETEKTMTRASIK